MKRTSVGLLTGCAVLLLLCAGCASKPAKVKLGYAPGARSLLTDQTRASVCLQVVDRRPADEQQAVGVQRNTLLGTKHAPVVSKTPETQVIYDALKVELEKSGHRVLSPGQGPVAITLEVGLTQFLCDSKASGDNIELVGSIKAEVIASASSSNSSPVSFTVESTYRDFEQMGMLRPLVRASVFGMFGMFSSKTPDSHIEKAMNGTLSEFVRRFFMEPKLRQVFDTPRS